MRAVFAFMVLLAFVTEAQAQDLELQARPHDDVWERILARLEAIPDRWEKLPEPIISPSGRLPEQILDAATAAEREAADALLSRLVLASPRARARLLAEAQSQHTLTEVALWWPLQMAREQQLHSFDEAARTLEAWLELAEYLGRRDALLRAAGAALDLAWRLVPPARLGVVAKRWSTLPPGLHGLHGAASVHGAHGIILSRTGRFSQALDAYRTARRLYLAVRDQIGQGYSWCGEARGLYLSGQHDGALAAYREARALYSSAGDRVGQGDTWAGEADVLFLLGQHDGALAAYREARVLYSAMGDQRGLGQSWRGEADVLFRLGKYDIALAACRQARAHYSLVGDRLGWGNTWSVEADILFRINQNDGALAAHHEARAAYELVGDRLGQGYSWLGEADLLLLLGQHDGALVAYREALSLFSSIHNNFGQGYAWYGEADVLARLGQYHSAVAAYRNARGFFSLTGDQLGQGNAWCGEAAVLLSLSQYDSALAAYREARFLLSSVGSHLGQGNSWLGEAVVLSRLNQFGPALLAAGRAARLARKMGSVENELLARMAEARILLASNQETRAIRRAEEALALLLRWRRTGVSDLDRTAISNMEAPYDLLIPLFARKHGAMVERALALAEEAHAPVLLDLLVTGSRRRDGNGDTSRIERWRSLQHRLAQMDRELQDTIAPDRRRELLRDRAALDVQVELNEMIALGSLGSTLVNGAPIDARTRHALVREVGPVLLYYVAENETVAFLLQPGQRRPLVRHIELSRERLQREVQALRHGLANPLWKHASRERQRVLHDQLLAPFADALAGTPRLTIVPHGPLHELPFEALLIDDETPVFERWHVTVAQSLSVLHALRRRRAERQPPAREVAFLGIAGGTGLALPAREVNEVGAWFGPSARIVAQQADSRAAYAELAPDARHILISSHGRHVARSRSGYLELSAADGVPTRLTAGAIAHIPLRAELVTLAACETARGEAMQSDERLDLTRAFLIAGAGAVLATRWRVPEHPSTRRFLLDFFQALREGGPGGAGLRKDEALTEARRRSRARGDSAQLWAAWVLVGDAR